MQYQVSGQTKKSAKILEVSLLGVGTVLRLERDAGFNGQMTKASNK